MPSGQPFFSSAIFARTASEMPIAFDARALEHADADRGFVVEHRAKRVVVRAELDARDVAKARDLAVAARAHDDVAEVLLVDEAALRVERDLEARLAIRRLPAPPAEPSWPAATCAFCSRIALATSPAVRPRAATFSGSSQMRIE